MHPLYCDCSMCQRYWAEETNVHNLDCDCAYCVADDRQQQEEEYFLREFGDPADGWPTDADAPLEDTVVCA